MVIGSAGGRCPAGAASRSRWHRPGTGRSEIHGWQGERRTPLQPRSPRAAGPFPHAGGAAVTDIVLWMVDHGPVVLAGLAVGALLAVIIAAYGGGPDAW